MKFFKYFLFFLFLFNFIHIINSQSVDDIIHKYISAIGDIDKINSIQTVKIYERIPRRGNEVPLIIIIKRPDKIRTEVTMQGQTQISAYDGDKSWTLNPFRGSRDVEKLNMEQTKNLKISAQFEGQLVNYKDKGSTVELIGKDDLEGTDVYKINLTNKDGDVNIYYIDAETYLLLKQVSKRKIKEIETSTDTELGNYKSEDGYLMPHSLEVKPSSSRGDPQKITIEKVEFNIPLDDNIFSMPDGK
jgi:outer membrane lipoprotein-sorting protein